MKNSKISKNLKAILPSVIAIFVALFVGGIIMASKGVNPINAYISMFSAAFYQSSPKSPFMSGLAKTIIYSTPLLFSALAAMIASKAGMFNIGAQGQMMAGGLGATIVGLYAHGIFANVFVAILAAMLFGFLWAGIAGILKARFGVNEVISTIMLNYIMTELIIYLIGSPMRDTVTNQFQTFKIQESTRMPILFGEITKQNLNIGFIIGVITVILIYYFFKKTKLGYDIKAVGFNPTVAENAGINPHVIAFIAMGIAGAVAGLGGAERILGGSTQYAYTERIMGDFGFTGLAVSLLGKNNPFGILIASIFYASLEIGGQTLQLKYQLDKDIIYIIQALLIILVAAENIFKYFINRKEQ